MMEKGFFMNHLVIFILATLIPSLASADLSVGDRSVYKGVVNRANGQTLKAQKTIEVIDYDQTSDEWVLKHEELIGSQESTTLLRMHRNEVFDRGAFSELISTCNLRDGKVIDLLIGAGTFVSCHFTKGKDQLWYADVPFGVAKEIDEVDGDLKIYELEQFRR